MKLMVQPSGSVLAAAPANPLVAQGAQIYQAQSCNACHGDAGVGTAAAPKLTGIGDHISKDQLENLLKAPSPKMIAGGMSPLNLPEDQMNALEFYLKSLK